ncbi:MAG TPA: isoaspartyl peptidase/L-asparaginase [Alphaproteobacteria bacterium]|nr:isoaspartyl peptidase/L-asparaginase [Alphaproteobacteria bacterium]
MRERENGYVLALHGGAEEPPKGQEEEAHAGLQAALRAGRAVLEGGGSAVEAVTAAVSALEDCHVFNSGHGAAFFADGSQAMDASIMDGRNHSAGAVANIFGPRNPVQAARLVMEKSDHVLMVGEGALAFCREHGIAMADRDYFFTEKKWRALQQTLAEKGQEPSALPRFRDTVGAVARDRQGNLAAATSTGGLTASLPGRVSDTACIGSGTFADNAVCAVTATGDGEVFMRWAAAHAVAARMQFAGQSAEQAGREVIFDLIGPGGGTGGLVVLAPDGTVAMPFNAEGMLRGYVREGGLLHTALADEPYRKTEA